MFGRDGRTAVRSDLAIRIRRTGFRPRRANGFAAQAQVAAWARRESARVPPSRPWAELWLRAAGPRVCWLGRNGLMNRNSSKFSFIFPEIYILMNFNWKLMQIFVQFLSNDNFVQRTVQYLRVSGKIIMGIFKFSATYLK